MGILFGIVAAVCWGTGDFLITHLTRRIGTSKAMVYIQTLSLLGWIGMALTQARPDSAGANIWLVAAGAGVCHVAGLLLTYRAFEIGTLSLVSPIASGFAVVTAVLMLTSGSEQPPALAIGGSGLLILGVVVATRVQGEGDKRTLAGVPEAIGSALAFGAMFWMIDVYVTPSLGFAAPLILLKTMALGSALMSLLASRVAVAQAASASGGVTLVVAPSAGDGAAASGRPFVLWALALGAAGTDVLAWLAWTWGTRTEYATIVTALASLFSVVTILLAWGFLRERLSASQWRGVAIILLGILLVSM